MIDARYRDAFLDWLACAVAGSPETDAVTGPDGDLENPTFDAIVRIGTAGHVLDYDDTYAPGLSHLSAATAPVALVLAAQLHRSIGDMLAAYATGFEAMARVSAASHPHLYDAGWHATAVTGCVGAAVTASHVIGLDHEQTRHAVRVALLGAGGLRTAFGSVGKPLQVGLAAANGAVSARLAARGAAVPPTVESGPGGFTEVYGGDISTVLVAPREPAIASNWLKAYPCCLQTHGPIDAALQLRSRSIDLNGHGRVVVHPVSRQAAAYDDVSTGLEAKFSIPYTIAWSLLHGRPVRSTFGGTDDQVRELASRIKVETDAGLGANATVLTWYDGHEHVVEIEHPRGSPQNPLTFEERRSKLLDLAGVELLDLLDDPQGPARGVASVVGV